MDADALAPRPSASRRTGRASRTGPPPYRGSAPSSLRAAPPSSQAWRGCGLSPASALVDRRGWVVTSAGTTKPPSSCQPYSALRRILSIFPVDASGMFGTRITASGIHQVAICPCRAASIVSSLIDRCSRVSTTSIGRSPHFASERPMTAARDTSGKSTDDSLDLCRIDPFASGLDQVLGPAGDDQVTVAVDPRKVAGIEPSARVRGRALIAEVALDGAGAAHAQMSFDVALLRQRPPVRVRQQEVHADRGATRDCGRSLARRAGMTWCPRETVRSCPSSSARRRRGAARCGP